jgi:transposase
VELYVGVDWARHSGVVVALVGETEHRFKYERNVEAIQSLVNKLRGLVGPDSVIRAVIEAGDNGTALLLSRNGVIVHVVDPKQAKRHAESLRSTRAKDDRRDARNLAVMAQSEPHRGAPFAVPDAKREALELLVSEVESSGNRQQRLVNQLRAKLVDAAPAVEQALGDLCSKLALALIEMAPTASHGKAIDDATWQQFCLTHRVRKGDREALRAAIQAPWRELNPLLADVIANVIRHTVQELRAAVASSQAVEDMLEKLLEDEAHAARLQTIKGIGTKLAAMLTVLGATEAKDRDELTTLVGVSPVTIQSGKSKVVSQRLEISTTAKRTAFLLGMMAARWLPWGKAMYADGRNRKQTHAHAARRVGRSLLRIIYSMLTKQTDYDDTKYVESLKRRGVSWASAIPTAPAV